MVKVYPLAPTSLRLTHPLGAKVVADGSDWPDDSDTGRLLAHGEITDDPSLAYKGEPVVAAAPPPGPVPATGGGMGPGTPGTVTMKAGGPSIAGGPPTGAGPAKK